MIVLPSLYTLLLLVRRDSKCNLRYNFFLSITDAYNFLGAACTWAKVTIKRIKSFISNVVYMYSMYARLVVNIAQYCRSKMTLWHGMKAQKGSRGIALAQYLYNIIMICYIFHAINLTSNSIKEIQICSQVTCLQILLVHFLPTGYYRNPSESDNDDQMVGKMGWWDIRQCHILLMKILNPVDQVLQVKLCVDAHDQCHSPVAMSWTDCPALSQFLQLELILQTLLLSGNLCWLFVLVFLPCCFLLPGYPTDSVAELSVMEWFLYVSFLLCDVCILYKCGRN